MNYIYKYINYLYKYIKYIDYNYIQNYDIKYAN